MLAASGYARFVEPWWIDYSHTRIPVNALPTAFEGLRIAHLSDWHCNPVSPEEIENWVDKTNHLGADLIALTGDYVTGKSLANVNEVVARLKHLRAPLGAGIEVLVNGYTTRRRNGDTLTLAGAGDLWTEDFDREFTDDVPGRPLVVLAHNPDTLYSLHGHNFDLMLSGHTHGGQVKFPFLGPPRLPIRHRHLAEGHFTYERSQIYVSRGLGYLTPIRFRARPELGIVELARA